MFNVFCEKNSQRDARVFKKRGFFNFGKRDQRSFVDRRWGQVTLEFAFAMVVVILLMYAIIQVMSWIATSLAQRRVSGDSSLTSITDVENWNDIYTDPSPLSQLQPEFYSPKKLKLVFNAW